VSIELLGGAGLRGRGDQRRLQRLARTGLARRREERAVEAAGRHHRGGEEAAAQEGPTRRVGHLVLADGGAAPDDHPISSTIVTLSPLPRMAERPDLEYVVPILAAELRGREIATVRVKKPVVLRVAVEGKFEELVVGRRFGAVTRRAHFVLFDIGD